MDLSKIGKCELCVLAKQVRAKKIEIGEKAKDTGTWDDETDERIRTYKRCAESLESVMMLMHRFESRKHMPTRNLEELVTGTEEEKEQRRIIHEEMIQEALRLLACEASGNSQ